MSLNALKFCWGPAWEHYYAQFWSEEEVINRIRSRHKAGQGISLAAVSGAKEWRLIRAAAYYFGSWRAAVQAAGFDYDKVREDIKWTRESVIRAIRRMRRRGEDLHSRAVQINHPALFAAAVRERLFGSWEAAIEAAGLSYDRICLYEHWDRERLRERIERLKARGAPLNAKSVLERDSALYHAAINHLGCWNRALRELGYDCARIAIRRKREPDEILRDLRRLAAQGHSMSDTNVRRLAPAVYAAACKTFGCWTRARAAAGIPWPRRNGAARPAARGGKRTSR